MISIFTGFRVRTIRWNTTNSPDICCWFAEVAFNLLYVCSGCRTLPCRFPWPVSFWPTRRIFCLRFSMRSPRAICALIDFLRCGLLFPQAVGRRWGSFQFRRTSVQSVDRGRFRIVTVLCVWFRDYETALCGVGVTRASVCVGLINQSRGASGN